MRAVQGMVYALVKMIARPFTTIHLFLGQFIEQDVKVSYLLFIKEDCTVSKRVLILRTWSLIRAFLAFWVLNGSLFIFQGPYFHFFGFIHAKNVNSVCMYTTMVPV